MSVAFSSIHVTLLSRQTVGKKNVIKQKTEFTNSDQCSRGRKNGTMGLVDFYDELGGETDCKALPET